MDFFARQDQARRHTGLLIFYFLLAVLLIVLAVNGVVYFFIAYFADAQISSMPRETGLDDSIWLYISLFTLAVIASGSLFRFLALARGGVAVASMAGARPVSLDSKEAHERRYINVVEEMSIASGVPMPRLYVMEEETGINAFVAGYRPTEAVMVVTRGALDEFSRDELQGVVGHEFSHILNGDMRINIRLLAILAGILLIGKVGEIFMRGSGRNSRGKNQGMILGLALFAVGYIGLFFGRLIKAAISRQREFLADASAVQFTRNPSGIAGALYKIKQSVNGTLLNNSHAEDMSHMCFGETMRFSFKRLLATHPPLDERIKAVDPNFLRLRQQQTLGDEARATAVPGAAMGFAGDSGIQASAEGLAESVGNPSAEHLAYGRQVHDRFDTAMLDLLHTPMGAEALIYALLLNRMDRSQGMAFLQNEIDAALLSLVVGQQSVIEQLDKRLRLPMIDIAIASLKQLDDDSRGQFLQRLERLIKLDRKYSLLEFVVLTILQQRLAADASRVNRVSYYSFKAVHEDIRLLLSMLAQCSGQGANRVTAAYQRNMKTFFSEPPPLLPVNDINISMITRSLQRIDQMPALMKKTLLTSCADLVMEDGLIMPAEAELLRAVAESIDCPMPPLLPS
jgi:Zn-dependent protease with chaperone function